MICVDDVAEPSEGVGRPIGNEPPQRLRLVLRAARAESEAHAIVHGGRPLGSGGEAHDGVREEKEEEGAHGGVSGVAVQHDRARSRQRRRNLSH